jgi:hypothetical protein
MIKILIYKSCILLVLYCIVILWWLVNITLTKRISEWRCYYHNFPSKKNLSYFVSYLHICYFPLPLFDSDSNRNEYQEYLLVGKGGRCVGLTTLPTSCAECHKIWEPQPPGTVRACPGQHRDCFYHQSSRYSPALQPTHRKIFFTSRVSCTCLRPWQLF